MLKSNKPERFIIIESLSIASVLEHETHPGFLNDFVRFDDRDLPVRRYAERGYPAEWWTSDCGVNMEAVRGLFPSLTSELTSPLRTRQGLLCGSACLSFTGDDPLLGDAANLWDDLRGARRADLDRS